MWEIQISFYWLEIYRAPFFSDLSLNWNLFICLSLSYFCKVLLHPVIIFATSSLLLLLLRRFSRLQLRATPWTAAHQAPPGSSVHQTLQTRILEWVASSSPFLVKEGQKLHGFVLGRKWSTVVKPVQKVHTSFYFHLSFSLVFIFSFNF